MHAELRTKLDPVLPERFRQRGIADVAGVFQRHVGEAFHRQRILEFGFVQSFDDRAVIEVASAGNLVIELGVFAFVIFQMHVPDAVAEAFDEADGIDPFDGEITRVEIHAE